MNINELIANIKNKLKTNIIIENIKIEDKTFFTKIIVVIKKENFILKILIQSQQLKQMSKIESNKKIYNLLDKEIKNYIHSIQILVD